MGNRAQRFGIRIGRGWAVLLLIAGSLLIAAYWIGPLRPLPAQLELLAIAGDSAVAEITVQPRRTAAGGVVFPVPLAVRNVGAQTVRTTEVVLSVPPQFRISTPRGRVEPGVTAGVPLRRYRIPIQRTELEPAVQTEVLPGLDTIYLEPDLPPYYCFTQGAQIPEFTSAPQFDAQTLSDIRIFYSFRNASTRERQTGLLRVHVDPALIETRPAPSPPTFPTVIEMPEARAPETGTLLFAGARTAHCGDPEQPVELYTALWETRDGGRVYVVYVDDVGRKRLYDMNSDGIIELETWDSDADGRFEARRDARFPVPGFLSPLPPRDPQMALPDPVAPDSGWLALFHSPQEGPDRFARSSLVAHPQVAVADTMAADSAAGTATSELASSDSVRPAGTRLPGDPDLSDVRPATPQFLALFADTAAGPFRFTRRPAPTAQAPARPDTLAAGAQADTAAPAEPEPAPRPRRRQPLGTPIRPPR
ncbi:MAG TPA: hypothetical protein VK912_14440 [Longimicrobiales bacterium]|nr:hypothetical protein [Longimicrobiales bacterium]